MAGTYSDGAASECMPCAKNKFSQKGAAGCTDCKTKTEYSRERHPFATPLFCCENDNILNAWLRCDIVWSGYRQCLTCDVSVSGAEKCLERPPCTDRDYFQYQTACVDNQVATLMPVFSRNATHVLVLRCPLPINICCCFQTKTEYHWIPNRVCREDLAESVKRPDASAPQSCPPCNPGKQLLYYTDSSSFPVGPAEHTLSFIIYCDSTFISRIADLY